MTPSKTALQLMEEREFSANQEFFWANTELWPQLRTLLRLRRALEERCPCQRSGVQTENAGGSGSSGTPKQETKSTGSNTKGQNNQAGPCEKRAKVAGRHP
jgi:hypothetical protein